MIIWLPWRYFWLFFQLFQVFLCTFSVVFTCYSHKYCTVFSNYYLSNFLRVPIGYYLGNYIWHCFWNLMCVTGLNRLENGSRPLAETLPIKDYFRMYNIYTKQLGRKSKKLCNACISVLIDWPFLATQRTKEMRSFLYAVPMIFHRHPTTNDL